jgi:segregation and condensation protein B
MVRDEGSGSLADQAASWVPPWSRAAPAPSSAPSPDDSEGESTEDTIDITPHVGDGARAASAGSVGGYGVVAPREPSEPLALVPDEAAAGDAEPDGLAPAGVEPDGLASVGVEPDGAAATGVEPDGLAAPDAESDGVGPAAGGGESQDAVVAGDGALGAGFAAGVDGPAGGGAVGLLDPLEPEPPLEPGEPLLPDEPLLPAEPLPPLEPSLPDEPLLPGEPLMLAEPDAPVGSGESPPGGALADEPLASVGESGETHVTAVPEEELRGAVEAILLVVDEPVTEIVLAQITEQPTDRIAALLIDLAAWYVRNDRGFELRRVAGGWRLYTHARYAAYVEKFVTDGQQVRLTQAALETLAVVAYKQPVTRSRISAIRGVNCDGVVRTLLNRGLIEECGSEPDSNAHLYRTTTLFLEKLGLDSVAELPALAPFLPDDVEALADAHG